MRIGLVGVLSMSALVSTVATAGCADYTGEEEPAGTGGASSTGGTAQTGGGPGTGGAAETGGAPVQTGGSPGTGGAPGTGGGAGTAITTIDGATVLSALTAEQVTQLCDDSYAYYYESGAIPVATACKWKGLSFATSSSAPTQEQLRSNCSEKEDGCVADPATAFADNPGCYGVPATCGATVAEYSTCVQDLATSFNTTVDAIEACDVLTTGDQGTGAVWAATGAAAPASCTFANCSGLYPPNPLF